MAGMKTESLHLGEHLETAVRAAHAGAALLQSHAHRRSDLVIDKKARNDLVSQADRDAERAILDILVTDTPHLGIVAEESGGDAQGLASWFIDPLDGTTNFLHGIPHYAVSIALVAHAGTVLPGSGPLEKDTPVIGVVYDPNHRELFHALKGQGAWLNDAPIAPHPAATVKEGVMGVGTSHRVTPAVFLPFLDALLSDGGMFIRNGSGALMSAWAAAGRLIGYYEPHMNPWDGLPGLVLMREAGGLSNDYLANDGIRHGNPLLLASKTLYPQLKKMLCHPLP